MSGFTVRRRAAGDTAGPPAGPAAVDPSAVTARPVAAPPPGALTADDGLDRYLSGRSVRARQAVVVAFISLFLIGPLASQFGHHPKPETAILLFGGLVFLLVAGWLVITPPHRMARTPWPLLIVVVLLGSFLFIVGGSENWLVIPAFAAACCGRFTATVRPAAFGSIVCGAAGLAVAVQHHLSLGNGLIVTGVPAMATFFAYSTGKRNEAVETLRQTRAELARVAVAEERLRIARDLHDLLGHSLSLITLKAELSRRMIPADAAGAEREMSELEAVARQSLSDVRAAVAGYRQPHLTDELGAARQMLTAAGIASQISVPDDLDLPAAADTVLAWTVREGVTNLVRHARATSAAITVQPGPDRVTAEITDDGGGLPAAAPWPAAGGGSGLAGLGERVRKLGGELTAGPLAPSGFRLRVTIPAGEPASIPEP